MKKILVILTTFFSMFQMIQAQGVSDNLVISTQDGNSVAYSLSTRPVVTFEGTDLVLTSSDIVVRYPIIDVKDITFAEATDNAIGEVKGNITFAINGNRIIAKGLDKGVTMQVFSTDGKSIASAKTNASGEAIIDISKLGHGIYVVKAGKKTYKVMK